MFLSFLLYPLHLWCVNLSVGALLLSLWLEIRGRSSPRAWRVNMRLSRFAWLSLVAGSAAGTLHLAVIWDETWLAKLQLAKSRVGFGVVELLVSLILMFGYEIWLRKKQSPARGRALLRWLFPLVAGTNLLYHVPPLFGVLRQLDVDNFASGSTMNSADFRGAMLTGEVIAPWIHFGLACLAVGAIVALLVNLSMKSQQAGAIDSLRDAQDCLVLGRTLACVSAAATLLQWVVGPLVFVYLQRHVQFELTGADWILTGWFLQNVVLAGLLSVLQVRLTLKPDDVSMAWQVLWAQVIVIVAMSVLVLATG